MNIYIFDQKRPYDPYVQNGYLMVSWYSPFSPDFWMIWMP